MSSNLAFRTVTTRRAHDRVELSVHVSLESDHNFFTGLCENISEGGLFVATHSLREIGTPIVLEFTLPERAQPIVVLAVVRWIRLYSETSDAPPGLGLQFVDITPEDAEAIRYFVEERAPLFWD